MTSVDGANSSNSVQQTENNSLDIGELDGESETFQEVQEAFSERIADLESQIAESDDPAEIAQLQNEIGILRNAQSQFESEAQSLRQMYGGGAADGLEGSSVPQSVQADFQELVDDARQTISDSYAEYGTAQVSSETEQSLPDWLPMSEEQLEGVITPEVDRELAADPADFVGQTGETESAEQTDGVDGTTESTETESASETTGADSTSESAEADSASETGGSEGGGEGLEGLDRSAEEMVNLMSNDPDAFMEEMSSLDPEDRMLAMNTIQQQLQEMNQMFQMMSQFSQAIHDTQKSVIQNMRV